MNGSSPQDFPSYSPTNVYELNRTGNLSEIEKLDTDCISENTIDSNRPTRQTDSTSSLKLKVPLIYQQTKLIVLN